MDTRNNGGFTSRCRCRPLGVGKGLGGRLGYVPPLPSKHQEKPRGKGIGFGNGLETSELDLRSLTNYKSSSILWHDTLPMFSIAIFTNRYCMFMRNQFMQVNTSQSIESANMSNAISIGDGFVYKWMWLIQALTLKCCFIVQWANKQSSHLLIVSVCTLSPSP